MKFEFVNLLQEEFIVAVIMMKYRWNNVDYLVYDRQLLQKEFTADEWATIADGIYGVGATYIIEKSANQYTIYNSHGQCIAMNDDCNTIIDYYLSSDNHRTDIKQMEVRFTNSYIKSLAACFLSLKRYIA